MEELLKKGELDEHEITPLDSEGVLPLLRERARVSVTMMAALSHPI